MTRIGSLFSGYGGLDMAAQAAIGGTVAWHSDIDPAASKILAHHWPAVPNHGDLTKVDWATVEPVDVLTGGFPCQDLSHAGKRLGLRPGTRSGLWSHMAYAISQLRPKTVVIENVRGLLSAEAHSDLEPCPWCVGDGEGCALRALGAVLGDLAGFGYDTRWAGVRASDAGAPHGRFRVFVAATDTSRGPFAGTGATRLGLRITTERGDQSPTDTEGDRSAHVFPGGREPALTEPAGDQRTPPDAGGERHGGRQDGAGLGRVDGDHAVRPRQRERAREVAGGGSTAAHGGGLDGLAGGPGQEAGRCEGGSGDGCSAWGQYAPAVHRWEICLGRLAPCPTVASSTGGRRLSVHAVEWMMGLPAGHVTDPAIGISRNAQLKALGNGVVPQQAALALRMLLGAQGVAA